MIAAFFDIDGTLYRDSLMVEHFKKLIRYEVVDPLVWHSNTKKNFHDWDKRQGNYDDYLFVKFIKFFDKIIMFFLML